MNGIRARLLNRDTKASKCGLKVSPTPPNLQLDSSNKPDHRVGESLIKHLGLPATFPGVTLQWKFNRQLTTAIMQSHVAWAFKCNRAMTITEVISSDCCQGSGATNWGTLPLTSTWQAKCVKISRTHPPSAWSKLQLWIDGWTCSSLYHMPDRLVASGLCRC